MNKITTCLWHNDQAAAAAELYCSLFPDSHIGQASSLVTSFTLAGSSFMTLNGGPVFTFTPAISLFVYCSSAAQLDALYSALVTDGNIMMPLDKYPFSERYAWIEDRYGLSWQLFLVQEGEAEEQMIKPCLLFVGEQYGRGQEALDFYLSCFKNSALQTIDKVTDPQAGKPGAINHCSFELDGCEFVLMDGAGDHKFAFNEAVSLVVDCATQGEVDYFWEALSEGGETGQCGWLKDKFGVSWQIVPTVLKDLMNDPARAALVMPALLKMTKLDIAALENA